MDPVSIAHLLERVRHRHAPLVAERHITLTTEQEPIVGLLDGDQNRLEQALQNLVANARPAHARRWGRDGHRLAEGRMWFCASKTRAQGFRLTIGRVFDRFYKVDQSRTGTGRRPAAALGCRSSTPLSPVTAARSLWPTRQVVVARFEIVLPLTQPDAPA